MSGRYTPQFLDEIRSRLSVSQVVGRKVALKKKGREWAGLSPFKTEKTPSFFVNDQKGFYHCFASGEHGDIFSFLIKTEGVSFSEAVERLAGEAGVPLPKRDAVQEEVYRKRLTLYDVMEAAANFFESQLQSSIGADAREYLAQRGLNPNTLSEFRFGYAPTIRTALKSSLIDKGFSESQLLECGLLIKPENGEAPYDRFRDRVMIPIHDHRGRVIAFGGRAIRKEVIPKYLNSPETPLFIKGQTVFNFHRARQTAFEKDDVIIVEGYLDAVAIYQAGIKNVVASLGTALTEAQINSLWQLASSPTICFDGDRAGRDAAYKATHKILPLLRPEKSFRFAFMVGAKDPDELIKSSGLAAFSKIIAAAVPLHDALWQAETDMADARTPERKAAFERQIYKLVNGIEDAAVRKQYINTYRLRLSKYFWEKSDNKKKSSQTFALPVPDGLAIEQIILGMSVEYPELFDNYHERFLGLPFCERHRLFLNALVDVLVTLKDRPIAAIYENIDPAFFAVLDKVHGNENLERGLKYGHNLRARCPVLRLEPNLAFVERLFLLMIAKLELRVERDELEQRYQTIARDAPDETWDALDRWGRDLSVKVEALMAEEAEIAALELEMDRSFHPQRHYQKQAA